MWVVALLAFKPQALYVLRRRLYGVYSLCVVVLLAFKPPGSVRSKAAIMCCLFIVCFCFQCMLSYA